MRTYKPQNGFALLELLLVLVVLAGIAFAGFWVYQKQADKDNKPAAAASTPSSNQQPKANNVSTAPEVKSTSDLDKAAQTLDQNDPAAANSADSGSLDTQSNF